MDRIKILLKDGKEYDIGDPFIMRFDGIYYLYPSTYKDECGVRCFTSNDLLSFEDRGFVAIDERLKNAYAPEVIYKDGLFYMCTSPMGNGHYLLKSRSPLGPFKFITDNVHQMIDGSFILDRDFNLKFVRADHAGIAMLDIDDDYRFTNRHEILPQISFGWTEGPSIFYEGDRYYALYCGNYVWSKNYRIMYATSRKIDRDYKTSPTPLLLKTDDDFNSLGHCSVTRSPSLLDRLVCYHYRDDDSTHRHLKIDKIHINGSSLDVDIYDGIRRYDSSDISLDFKKEKLSISKKIDLKSKDIIAEINFIGEIEIDLKADEDHIIKVEDRKLTIKSDSTTISESIDIDIRYLHTLLLKIINGEAEILIDEVPVTRFEIEGYRYLLLLSRCLLSKVNCSAIKEKKEIFNIPCTIESSDITDDLYVDKLYEDKYTKLNKLVTINVKACELSKYKLYAYMSTSSDVTLSIDTISSHSIIDIKTLDSDYPFLLKEVITLDLKSLDKITLTKIKGECKIKRFVLKKVEEPIAYDDSGIHLSKEEVSSITFKINRFTKESLFGIMFDVTNPVSHSSVKDIKCNGYLLGFRNDLMVLEHLNYDTSRVYDVPLPMSIGKVYTLKMKRVDRHVKVYLDDRFIFETDLPYMDISSQSGIYNYDEDSVEILNFRGGNL